jgi:hypothetical protein
VQSIHRQNLTCHELWGLTKKYRRLALVQAPSTLFNSLGLYLPGMLAAPYFGAGFAGEFFMGAKVIALPFALLGGALSQVFFSGAAALIRERPQDLARFFDRVSVLGAACSLLVLAAGAVAPYVVPFALGTKWREAGEIAFWLSLYNMIGVGVAALSAIPTLVGRLQGQFVIDVARAVAVFLIFFLGHRFGLPGMTVVKAFVIVMIFNYLACYWLYRHQVKAVSTSGRTGWNEPGDPLSPQAGKIAGVAPTEAA